MFDDDFDDDFDDYNPVEPFSEAEFVVHNNRQLRNLDAGRDSDDPDSVECPDYGSMVRICEGDEVAVCKKCGCDFDVD